MPHRAFRLLAVLALLLAGLASQAVAAPLPQDHEYQKTLRAYFATLTEEDFKVELKNVEYLPDYFTDLETVARYWMLFLDRGDAPPPHEGLRVDPVHFTLTAIEAGEGINMAAGRGQFMDPKDTAWWTVWDYPGNPYFGSLPGKRRAFVAAAADMMAQDQEHEAGRNARSDYLGGSMIRYAYVYWAAREAVPQEVQDAYRDGLVRMFEKLEGMTPRGSGGSDMEFFQLVGMWYAADALGGDFHERAVKRAHHVIDTITSKTGYEKHGGAFDASYQGIALRFLTWAATLYEDPKINEALHKMLVLKAYLSLPEPDGKMFGPTHFSTGTAMDTVMDQWAWVSRDLAMAMIDDLALYTVKARVGVPSEAAIRQAVEQGIKSLGGSEPSQGKPAPWKEVHWVQTLNFAFDQYQPGFYQRLVQLEQEDSPLLKPPFGRGETFINDLNGGGEFLASRFGHYGAVIHTGVVARAWANGVSGKSGGSLSAFWTPQGGTYLLGRARATQSDKPDEWTDANGRGPYTWGVHAITGKGAGGHYFSTSRILNPQSQYEISGQERAVATVTGDLAGNQWADPQDELKGKADYRRTFALDEEGLTITSSLTLDGSDTISELWEILPIFWRDSSTKEPVAEVSFRVNGQWVRAGEEPVRADQVRITRHSQPVLITLDRPRQVKLGAEPTETTMARAFLRNLMIDLLEEGDNQPAVEYRIAAGAE